MKKTLALILTLALALTCVTSLAEGAYSFAFLPNTQNNTFQSTMNATNFIYYLY